jgi:hypothetical protein
MHRPLTKAESDYLVEHAIEQTRKAMHLALAEKRFTVSEGGENVFRFTIPVEVHIGPLDPELRGYVHPDR